MANNEPTRAFAQSQTVEYRDIPGFPGYRVGNDGTVWSCRNRWGRVAWHRLKASIGNQSGHLRVTLQRDDGPQERRGVHRLVLEAFVGPCPEGMEGCHYPDRNPANCAINNLRWDTPANNWDDARKHGTASQGEHCGTHKLTTAEVLEIRRLVPLLTLKAIGKRFNVTESAVCAIKNRRAWAWLEEDTAL